jgi:hypothetical protein
MALDFASLFRRAISHRFNDAGILLQRPRVIVDLQLQALILYPQPLIVPD